MTVPLAVFLAVSLTAPATYVSDEAQILNDSLRMENALAAYATDAPSGALGGALTQIHVFTARSLDGQTIEQYTARLWGQFGGRTKVFIVIAPVERKVRVYRGGGLYSRLPQHVTDHVIDEMTPALKAGHYDAAVWTGVGAIRTATSGGPRPTTTEAAYDGYDALEVIGFMILFAILIGVVIWLMTRQDRPRRRSTGGGHGNLHREYDRPIHTTENHFYGVTDSHSAGSVSSGSSSGHSSSGGSYDSGSSGSWGGDSGGSSDSGGGGGGDSGGGSSGDF